MSESQTFWVYILECRDGSFYTGQTSRLSQRILEHIKGQGSRYTRGRKPCRLCYTEQYKTRGDAMRRELEIKKLSHKQKYNLIFPEHT